MKKQYMDFVPTKAAKKTVRPVQKKQVVVQKQRVVATVVTAKPATKPVAKPVVTSKPVVAAKPAPTTKAGEKMAFSTEKEPKLGMVEDLGPKFVKTDVPKRPLSTTETMKIKAKKIGNKSENAPVEKPVEKSAKKSVEKPYEIPKNPFINQNKVQKRPLSKNVYTKEIVPPKEMPQGPVTIISKPEKQAHVGIIITIVLTIILGAAAGTIAFLLLPK